MELDWTGLFASVTSTVAVVAAVSALIPLFGKYWNVRNERAVNEALTQLRADERQIHRYRLTRIDTAEDVDASQRTTVPP